MFSNFTVTHLARGIGLSACLGLAACGGFNDQTDAMYDAQYSHPISVDPQVVTLELPTPQDKVTLTMVDKAAVASFASTYKERGHGLLTISAPSGSPNERVAINLVAELRKALSEFGVTDPKLGYAAYRASAANESAPIILSYRHYVATPSPCGNWSVDYAYMPENGHSPNYGCATQNNLAAAVADPADLLGPRDMTPADAARRSKVIEKYREGEVTATERTQGDSGAVSEVEQ